MNNLEQIFSENYKQIKLSIEEQQNRFKYLNLVRQETKDNLKNIIMNEINGDEISIQNIQNEISQLLIEYFINKKLNKEYYNFLHFLRDYTRENNSYNTKIFKNTNHKSGWMEVINIFSQWQNVNNTDYSSFTIDGLSSREKMIALTHKDLKKYNLEITNGKFKIDDTKTVIIANDLECMIHKIGAKYLLQYLFNKLQNENYNNQIKRYLLPKQFIQYTQKPKLSIPYNYLINLSVKYIDAQGEEKYQNKKYINKAINLSKRLVFIYDLQDFHNMNKNYFPQHWTIHTMHQNILYDNIFRFKQISLDKITYIINGIFNSIDIKEKLGFTLNEYVTLIEKLYTIGTNSLTEYPTFLFTSEEINILDKISILCS